MAMKEAFSEGDRLGSDEGGGCFGRYWSGRGGAHASVRERDGLGRAGWEAKVQGQWGEQAGRRLRPRRLGRKPELGPIQEIKPFQILFEIQFFANLGNLHKEI
jgi:hypothetical protein